jgi:hypothetical protein
MITGVQFIAENGGGADVRLHKADSLSITAAAFVAETIGAGLNALPAKAEKRPATDHKPKRSKTDEELVKDYGQPTLKLDSHTAAALLTVGLFAFDCATYGFASICLYVLKRSVGLDTFIGIDMVPDEAVEHALATIGRWMAGMHWFS